MARTPKLNAGSTPGSVSSVPLWTAANVPSSMKTGEPDESDSVAASYFTTNGSSPFTPPIERPNGLPPGNWKTKTVDFIDSSRCGMLIQPRRNELAEDNG